MRGRKKFLWLGLFVLITAVLTTACKRRLPLQQIHEIQYHFLDEDGTCKTLRIFSGDGNERTWFLATPRGTFRIQGDTAIFQALSNLSSTTANLTIEEIDQYDPEQGAWNTYTGDIPYRDKLESLLQAQFVPFATYLTDFDVRRTVYDRQGDVLHFWEPECVPGPDPQPDFGRGNGKAPPEEGGPGEPPPLGVPLKPKQPPPQPPKGGDGGTGKGPGTGDGPGGSANKGPDTGEGPPKEAEDNYGAGKGGGADAAGNGSGSSGGDISGPPPFPGEERGKPEFQGVIQDYRISFPPTRYEPCKPVRLVYTPNPDPNAPFQATLYLDNRGYRITIAFDRWMELRDGYGRWSPSQFREKLGALLQEPGVLQPLDPKTGEPSEETASYFNPARDSVALRLLERLFAFWSDKPYDVTWETPDVQPDGSIVFRGKSRDCYPTATPTPTPKPVAIAVTATPPPPGTPLPTPRPGEPTYTPTATQMVVVYVTPTPPPTNTPVPLANCPTQVDAGLEKAIMQRINEVRERHGLPPLEPNGALIQAARSHARDMACNKFIGHTGSDGSNALTRVSRQGYPASRIGENIFVSEGYPSAEQTVDSWMDSLYHQSNLLNTFAQHMGVGVIGLGTIFYIVSLFGSP